MHGTAIEKSRFSIRQNWWTKKGDESPNKVQRRDEKRR